MSTDHHTGDLLDRVARGLHAEAVTRVPGRTLLQLQARRHGAARGHAATRPPRALAWGLGAAFAAVFALAIGLRPGPPMPDPAPVPAVAATPAPAAADPDLDLDVLDAPFASLDEDPDLYLWLASADAQPLAME